MSWVTSVQWQRHIIAWVGWAAAELLGVQGKWMRNSTRLNLLWWYPLLCAWSPCLLPRLPHPNSSSCPAIQFFSFSFLFPLSLFYFFSYEKLSSSINSIFHKSPFLPFLFPSTLTNTFPCSPLPMLYTHIVVISVLICHWASVAPTLYAYIIAPFLYPTDSHPSNQPCCPHASTFSHNNRIWLVYKNGLENDCVPSSLLICMCWPFSLMLTR